jgi:hypothetical protein
MRCAETIGPKSNMDHGFEPQELSDRFRHTWEPVGFTAKRLEKLAQGGAQRNPGLTSSMRAALKERRISLGHEKMALHFEHRAGSAALSERAANDLYTQGSAALHPGLISLTASR